MTKLLVSFLLALGAIGLTLAKPQEQVKVCFFVDGKALCGEEGVRAQEEQQRLVKELMKRQQQPQLQRPASRRRGDDAELPQAKFYSISCIV
jgi:hypothetical protein